MIRRSAVMFATAGTSAVLFSIFAVAELNVTDPGYEDEIDKESDISVVAYVPSPDDTLCRLRVREGHTSRLNGPSGTFLQTDQADFQLYVENEWRIATVISAPSSGWPSTVNARTPIHVEAQIGDDESPDADHFGFANIYIKMDPLW